MKLIMMITTKVSQVVCNIRTLENSNVRMQLKSCQAVLPRSERQKGECKHGGFGWGSEGMHCSKNSITIDTLLACFSLSFFQV